MKNYLFIVLFLLICGSSFAQEPKVDSVKNKVDAKKNEILRFYDTTTMQFRYAVYTDAEGFKENSPNGLIQQEFYFSWPLINQPAFRIRRNGIEKVHVYFIRNIVIPNIQFNKIEDKEKYLPLIKSNGRFYINTFDLIQYATLTNYVKLNMITIGFRKQSRIYLDLMLNHILTKTIDSSSSGLNKYTVNSFGSGAHLRYQTNNKESFINLNMEISWFSLHLLNTEYRQFEGPRYKLISNNIVPIDTTFKKNNSQFRLQAEVTLDFSKLGKKEEGEKEKKSDDLIFIRTYLYTEKLPLFQNLHGINNNIFMFQIGYRKSLDDLKGLLIKKSSDPAKPAEQPNGTNEQKQKDTKKASSETVAL